MLQLMPQLTRLSLKLMAIMACVVISYIKYDWMAVHFCASNYSLVGKPNTS